VIPPIAPLPASPATTPGGGASGVGGTTGTGSGFAAQITNALGHLQQTQATASSLEAHAAAGQGSVTSAMVAATEASLETQVTVALTNKAITAFTDVMNLQI
jgi:flagellar hook-basal body complex protein FliE